jgi:hypothetical protein
MRKKKLNKIRMGVPFTDNDVRMLKKSLPESSIAKRRHCLEIEDELPADPMDWPAKWLYMYEEQAAINEVDQEMERSAAEKSAERYVRNEYKLERFNEVEIDLIVDWESFLPPDLRKKKKKK